MTAQILTLPVKATRKVENGTVPPARRRHAEVRVTEHLTESEVEKLLKAASATHAIVRLLLKAPDDRSMIVNPSDEHLDAVSLTPQYLYFHCSL
jgi:hypothetical protein